MKTNGFWAAGLLGLLVAGCGKAGGLPSQSCSPACPPGTTCTGDGCVPLNPVDMAVTGTDLAMECGGPCPVTAPHCSPTGACVVCLADGDCPQGSVCRMSGVTMACLPGCKDDLRCGGGSLRCCGGACIDTAKDPSHCGSCDTVCSGPHLDGACTDGACAGGACLPGWGDCNLMPGDGCEANLRVDPANCSGCGRACSIRNAINACADGCYIAACRYGWADCNGDVKDGCEVDTTGDLRNCGDCGAMCSAVPHARIACMSSACRLTACDPGFADCDGDPRTGCEINVNTDARSCGQCGMMCGQGLVCLNGGCTCQQCALPNARSACINLQCVVDSCLQGFLDCDLVAKNGCEVSGGIDAQNCGACGTTCGGMTPFCQGGQCSQIGASCAGIKKSNPNAPDGQYAIDPDGNGPIQPLQVYCDMTTDGGGWTIVYSTDAADNEVGISSDTVVNGNALAYGYSNLSRAVKMALSATSIASLFKRKLDGAWIKADAALFDGSLATPNSHLHRLVTLTASNGLTAPGAIGYANFNTNGGGDYGVSLNPDGATCQGNTIDGFDHHSVNYYHLNCGCQRQYLYSYSNNVADGDQAYNINTSLGSWTATQNCASVEGGGIVFYAAMR